MPDNSAFCPSCGGKTEEGYSANGNGKWKKICIVLVAIIAIAGLCIAISSCGGNGGTGAGGDSPQPTRRVTIAEYEQELIKNVKANTAPWVRTRPEIVLAIERKHGTVTVDGVDLKTLAVHTYDNTGFIQDDESNVESIEFVIRFWWDGIFHQDGHTDVLFVLVPSGDEMECRQCRVVDTDALVDLDDPAFWAGVGTMLFL